MASVTFSNNWFDRVPSVLLEWSDFFSALRYQLEVLISSSHTGVARLNLKEHQNSKCCYLDDEEDHFQLTFSFFEDSIDVYWASATLGADNFSVHKDLTWSNDRDDMGELDGLSPEFVAWLDTEETLAGKVAVMAIAIAKKWMITPPGQHSGMSLDVRGPWVD